MCISHSLSSLQKIAGLPGVGCREKWRCFNSAACSEKGPALRRDDTCSAIAKDANSNLQALGCVNLPSTFFSLHTLLVPLVSALAILFSISVCCSCLAKSSRLCLARGRNGPVWAWHLLPLQCTKSSAVSAQAHCIQPGQSSLGKLQVSATLQLLFAVWRGNESFSC